MYILTFFLKPFLSPNYIAPTSSYFLFELYSNVLTSTAIAPSPARRKEAMKLWLDAVDALFNSVDVDRNWREFASTPSNPVLRDLSIVNQLGLWGCLKCGIVLGKTAQYCLNSDSGRQVDMVSIQAKERHANGAL